MAEDPGASLVPYYQADPQIQAAYHAGLQRLRDLDALPESWTCTRCGGTIQGKDILISYIGALRCPAVPGQGIQIGFSWKGARTGAGKRETILCRV